MLYARSLCDDPEDAVAVAFGKLAYQAECPGEPLAWLFQVVRRAALDQTRKSQRRKRREQAHAKPISWFEDSFTEATEAAAAELTAALERLPACEREAVIARIWGEQTFAQIGVLLGVSTSTAQRWYESGLARLRERSLR